MRVVAFAGNLGSGKDTAADRVVTDHGFVRISLADPLKRLGQLVFHFSEDQLWGPSDSRNAIDGRYVALHPGLLPEEGPEWEYAADRVRRHGAEWLEDDVFPDHTPTFVITEAYALLLDWFDALRHEHMKLSPRIMLQSLGTEYGRVALHKEVWLDVALRNARELLNAEGTPEINLYAKKYSHVYGVLYAQHPGNDVQGVVIPDVRFPNELAAIKKAGGRIVRVYRPETDEKGQTTGIVGHASETSLSDVQDSEFDFILQNDGSLEEFLESVDVAARVVLTAG